MRYCFLFFILFQSALSGQSVVNPLIMSQVFSKRAELLMSGEKYLGLKYRSKYGKNIFDCSGFVKFLMAGVGVNITRSSVSIINDGKRVKDVKDAKPGDILVFKGRNARNNRPGHVGVVHHWSNDTLYFLHSSVMKGIVIDNLHDQYYAKRFLQVRDVIGKKE